MGVAIGSNIASYWKLNDRLAGLGNRRSGTIANWQAGCHRDWPVIWRRCRRPRARRERGQAWAYRCEGQEVDIVAVRHAREAGY
jgi:hypothetical protein